MKKDKNGNRKYNSGSYEGRWLEEFIYIADLVESIDKKLDKILSKKKKK
jgi:hypothetical protein